MTDRAKSGRKARTKGAAFERAVAADLRAWLGPGWEVLRNQTDRQAGQAGTHPGEFSFLGPAGARLPLAIECKNSAAFDLRHLWADAPVGPLPKWWAQAKAQAGTAYRPILVVKVLRGETLAFLEPGLFIRWEPEAEMTIDWYERPIVATRWTSVLRAMPPVEG